MTNRTRVFIILLLFLVCGTFTAAAATWEPAKSRDDKKPRPKNDNPNKDNDSAGKARSATLPFLDLCLDIPEDTFVFTVGSESLIVDRDARTCMRILMLPTSDRRSTTQIMGAAYPEFWLAGKSGPRYASMRTNQFLLCRRHDQNSRVQATWFTDKGKDARLLMAASWQTGKGKQLIDEMLQSLKHSKSASGDQAILEYNADKKVAKRYLDTLSKDRTVSAQVPRDGKKCKKCKGKGQTTDAYGMHHVCPKCGGYGIVPPKESLERCRACQGTGKGPNGKCTVCNGTGKTLTEKASTTKRIDIKPDANVVNLLKRYLGEESTTDEVHTDEHGDGEDNPDADREITGALSPRINNLTAFCIALDKAQRKGNPAAIAFVKLLSGPGRNTLVDISIENEDYKPTARQHRLLSNAFDKAYGELEEQEQQGINKLLKAEE